MVRADKHNGLDGRMFMSMNEAIEQLAGDDELRAVVLSGDGPSFCAGLDFKSFMRGGDGDRRRATGSRERRCDSPTSPSGSPTAWRELTVPVIAALHGACFGGGLQIALGADIRIAAPERRLWRWRSSTG